MIATYVNVLLVLIGSVLGFLFHRKINNEIRNVVYTGIGLFTLVIGMSMALQGKDVIIIVISLVSGGILGVFLQVEQRILDLGSWLKRVFRVKDSEEHGHNFAEAFLDSSLLFCIGAMSILGSFKAGVEGDYTILLTKSVMDGFVSIIMSAAMGIGVAFSTLVILVYQGGLTLLSSLLKPWVTESLLDNFSGLGGIMILMIGFNLLNLKKISTANYLPSLLVLVIIVIVKEQFFL